MAQLHTITFVDDLAGGLAVETVSFALDGVAYELDLNEANAAEMRAILGRYITAGRPAGTTVEADPNALQANDLQDQRLRLRGPSQVSARPAPPNTITSALDMDTRSPEAAVLISHFSLTSCSIRSYRTRRSGIMTCMARPPEGTKASLEQRLSTRARERWPQLDGVDVKFRANFAYVTGRLHDGDTLPLMRLRYGGSTARWGFAI